jgi:L-fucose isomerase-like protein
MLTKTEKRDLASKINSLMVAAMMRETCDSKDAWIWSRSEEEKVVELFDQYGIELPNLAMYLQERASKVRVLRYVDSI